MIFKKAGIKKILSLTAAFTVMFMVSGCSDTGEVVQEKDVVEESGAEESPVTAEDVAAVYQEILGEMSEDNGTVGLEMLRSIINRLGENGFSAVDSENQINMVCPEQIRNFCQQVEAQQEADASLVVVVSAISFVKYEFAAKEGNVTVQRSYYLCREGQWETASTVSYPAYTWVYSEGGYLFFEEYHMPGFDGPTGHTAVRIAPLDEKCRELGRKYLRTIGYGLNNLFITDWSEDDYQELNFYDLYNILRQMRNGRYDSEIYFEEGISYEIPKDEFESVFQTFFQIDADALRRNTTYHEETETYQYRQRGMFDFAPTPYSPYPEVISCEENPDGTLTLIVNAVWPEENLEKVFCHEVIIRPLKDGGFQFVSNHVIPSENNTDITWYAERLSDEEWQEYYEGMKDK